MARRGRCLADVHAGSLQARLLRLLTLCSAESADCSLALTEKQWFRVVVLCCAVAIINSIDRTAMSIAILPMSKTYHWSDKDKGIVSRSDTTPMCMPCMHVCSPCHACMCVCVYVCVQVCAALTVV